MLTGWVGIDPSPWLFSTWRMCSREQRNKQPDWLAINTDFITSQSHSCFYLFGFGPRLEAFTLYRVHMVMTLTHGIKLNSFKMNVALKSMIILWNLITTKRRKVVRVKMSPNWPNSMSWLRESDPIYSLNSNDWKFNLFIRKNNFFGTKGFLLKINPTGDWKKNQS